ncbi:hypothetical protein Ancab_011356 [Ancistrocladus abbreviatus]
MKITQLLVKRQRKSSSKEAKEKMEDTNGECETAQDEVAAKEAKDGMKVEMKDAEGMENHAEGDKTKYVVDVKDHIEEEKGHEVEGDALPQAKEGQTYGNEPEVGEKQDNSEVWQETPVPAEPMTSIEEQDVTEVDPNGAGLKAGEEVVEANQVKSNQRKTKFTKR